MDIIIGKKKLILFSMVLLVVLLQENFIYMTKLNTSFLLSITGLLIFLFKFGDIVKKPYTFKFLIISLMIVEFYGIMIGCIYYSQSFYEGIYGTHYIFMYGWYFAFVDAMRSNVNKKYAFYVKEILVFIGTFITVLLMIQGILYSKIVFLDLTYSMRNGLRIMGSYILSQVLTFIYVDIIYKFSFQKLIIAFLMTYYVIVYNQSRGTIMIFVICIVLIIMKRIISEKNILKITTMFLVILVGVILIIQTGFIQKIIQNIFFEVNENTGNVGVRLDAIKYYWDILLDHWLLGIGILGDKFELKELIYGTTQYYYYMEDIGTLAFLFKTGIVGLIWIILFYKKLFSIYL
ncbi:O-antigen ligase family protein, partial [Neobacillus soli]